MLFRVLLAAAVLATAVFAADVDLPDAGSQRTLQQFGGLSASQAQAQAQAQSLGLGGYGGGGSLSQAQAQAQSQSLGFGGGGGWGGRPGWGGGGWVGHRPYYGGGWGRKLMGTKQYGFDPYYAAGPVGYGPPVGNAVAVASSNGYTTYDVGQGSAFATANSFGRKLRRLLGADNIKCGGWGCGGGYYGGFGSPCGGGWGGWGGGGCGGGFGGGFSSSSAAARAEAGSSGFGGPFGGSGSAASAEAVASSNSFGGKK